MPTELSPEEIETQFAANVAEAVAKDGAALTGQPEPEPTPTPAAAETPAAEPVAAAPETPAPEVPAQTPGQQAQADFFSRLEAVGLKNLRDKYKSEEELARGIANAQQMLGRKTEDEEYGRWLRDGLSRNPTEVLRQLARMGGVPLEEAEAPPQQTQQPAPQPAQPENGHGLPEWNEQWQHQFRYDREKNQWLTVDPEADPADLPKYLLALQSRKQLLANPEKYLGPLVEQRARALIDPLKQELDQTRQQFLQQQQQAYAAQQAQQVVALRNSLSWAQAGYDPMTGQPALTPLGQMLDRQASHLASQGMPPLAAIQNAMQMMELAGHLKDGKPVQVAQPVAPQAVPPQPAAPKNKAPAIATAPVTPATSLSGTVAPPLGSDTSFEDAMRRAMQLDGINS